MEKPQVRIRRIWIIAAIGAVLGLGAGGNTPYGYLNLNPVNGIMTAVLLPLGYLLVVYLLGNFFTIRAKED